MLAPCCLAILGTSVFLAILSVCLGRNDRLFMWVSAGVLTEPGAWPSRLVGLASAVLSRAFPADLELGEKALGAPSWRSAQREPIPLLCESLSTLRTRSRGSDEWESCQSRAGRLGPRGASEIHPPAFCLKTLL